LLYVVRTEHIRSNVIEAVKAANFDQPIEVVIRTYKENRNLEQNKLFHSICAQVSENYSLSHGKYFAPLVFKQLFKQLFVGSTSIALPNGTIRDVDISTTELSVKQMASLIDKILVYCATEMSMEIELKTDK